jgi:hypothetical protein
MTENTGLHKVLTVEVKVQWCQLPIIKHCTRMWVREHTLQHCPLCNLRAVQT